MKSIEIESWALRALERAENHAPFEDFKVELKREWIDPTKAARRLAGHANAARGENILWLIGADETNGVVGANDQELSNWWATVQSAFESVVPALQNLNVTYKAKTISALCFDTSRFPYVVKNPMFGKTSGGPVEFEVPWRDGTRVRSATHNDLVLMLSPLSSIPKVEILNGEIRCKPHQGGGLAFQFILVVYIVPLDIAQVTLPFHKCRA